MKHAITLFLETDTIDWIDVCAKNLSRQRNREVTRHEVVDWLTERHWKKTIIRHEDKKFDKKVAAKQLARERA